jgi:hypothetical protein
MATWEDFPSVQNPALGDARSSSFADELGAPELRQHIYSLIANEVGGQGTAAQQAFTETLFNRARARGQSLSQVATDPNYYPGGSFRPRPGANYQDIVQAALRGSDVSKGATGNASRHGRFCWGTADIWAGGERFGIEGPT